MSVHVKLTVSAKATSDSCCWHKVNYRLQAAWTELMTWQVFLLNSSVPPITFFVPSDRHVYCCAFQTRRWDVQYTSGEKKTGWHCLCINDVVRLYQYINIHIFVRKLQPCVIVLFVGQICCPCLENLATRNRFAWNLAEHHAAEIISTYIHVNFILSIGP